MYAYHGILPTHKKKDISLLAAMLSTEDTAISEISHAEKHSHWMISFVCGI
jgi:galactose-1-phosphate uridylyltransferase